MTNAGKWAHYAPGNLGVEVVFGSMGNAWCPQGRGKVVRGDELWR